ncbi:MAG: hypothetical protein ACI8PZ_000321 [Myxococcota bacterium]|jgi:hypothetical protein
MRAWLLAGLIACAPGTIPEPPVQDVAPLFMADTDLPGGVVGERYDVALKVAGGLNPLTFARDTGQLPEGLRLTADGRISGRPQEAGSYEVTVVIGDRAGQREFARVWLKVERDPREVGCGEVLTGRFDGSAYGGDINFDDFDEYAWVDIRQPPPDITRIEVRSTSGLTAWVAQPGEALGSLDLEDSYDRYVLDPGESFEIDLATDPNLSQFRNQATIPIVISGNGASNWDLEVVCTDGPVFERLFQLPVPEHADFELDYDVLGSPPDQVRIWTDDPLPPWATLDEDGRLWGYAEEPGGWEFDIQAEDRQGRHRIERTLFGVYRKTDVKCGESYDFSPEQGIFQGTFTGLYDPRGFEVITVRYDQEVSELTLRLLGDQDGYVSIAQPDPYFEFYGNAEYEYGMNPSILLGTRTYPRWSNYADDGLVNVMTGPLYEGGAVALSVECNGAPRTDMPGLPVFEPGRDVLEPLVGVGESPPFTWTGEGFPPGISVEQELRTPGLEEGAHSVALTIRDRTGATHRDEYEFYVGEEAACQGVPMLPCGSEVSGTFTDPYYVQRTYDEDSTRSWCIVVSDEVSVHTQLQLADESEGYLFVGDPGRTITEVLYEDKVSMRFFGEEGEIVQANVAQYGWPGLSDYRKLPLFVTIQAYEPGDWVFRATCTSPD